jgi:outer membrane protein OmpU
MNKTLITLAVASVAAAGAHAGELYNQDGTTLSIGGRAEARLSIADGDVEDQSRARLNIKGTQALSDNLYGIGFYEAEYQTDDTDAGDTQDNRYIYAGIGSDEGLITYGKNDAAVGVITDFTDIMAYHGGAASSKLETSDRQDNMLTYQASLDQFDFKAAYRFADRTETNGEYDNNDAYGYSASAIYSIGDTGIALGAGYGYQNENVDSSSNDIGDANQYTLSVSYAVDNLYLAALYTDKDFDENSNDYKGYELAGSYNIDKTQFTTTYGYGETDSDTSVDSLAIEAAYHFKPNFKGYVSYNFNLLDADEAGSVSAAEDDAVLGLRYTF